MNWFKSEFSKSNIISGILALSIWGAIIYLAVVQAAIPDLLYAGGLSIIAFFFGAKVGEQNGEARARRLIGYEIDMHSPQGGL